MIEVGKQVTKYKGQVQGGIGYLLPSNDRFIGEAITTYSIYHKKKKIKNQIIRWLVDLVDIQVAIITSKPSWSQN